MNAFNPTQQAQQIIGNYYGLLMDYYEDYLYRQSEFAALCLLFEPGGAASLFVENNEYELHNYPRGYDDREFFVLHQYRSAEPLDGDAYTYDGEDGEQVSFENRLNSWIENTIQEEIAQAIESNSYVQADIRATIDQMLANDAHVIQQYMVRRNNPNEYGYSALCLDLRCPESPRLEVIESQDTVRDLMQTIDYFIVDEFFNSRGSGFLPLNPDNIPDEIFGCLQEHRTLLCGKM